MENKIAVVIFGPPGSGKGTQAERLAGRFNMHHLNLGGLIEKIVHDPARQDDSVIQRERRNFESGMLCTPEWVVEQVAGEVRRLAGEGKSIVFSGNPRTLPEAEHEIPLFEELYSKENIFFVRILVGPETSIFRNSHRRICSRCGQALIYTPDNEKLVSCPVCGGSLVTRTLDNIDAIKVRLQQYEDLTKPIFEYVEERGYAIHVVSGESDPDTVANEIQSKLLENPVTNRVNHPA